MNDAEVVKALGALAQESRLRLFRLLVVAGREGATPGQMGEALGIAPTSISFHMKELVNARLVSQERDGRHIIYRAQVDFPAFLRQVACHYSGRMIETALRLL